MTEKLSELLVSVLDDYLIDQAETMDRDAVIARVAALEQRVEEAEQESRVARIKLDRHHRTGLCSDCKNKPILVEERTVPRIGIRAMFRSIIGD